MAAPQQQRKRSIRLANSVQTQQPNFNALPIAHGPPWIMQELKKKHVYALRTMVRAYGIIEGRKWKKADLVKALYDYGQNMQQSVVMEEPPVNDMEPGTLYLKTIYDHVCAIS